MSNQTIANLPAAKKGATFVAIDKTGEWVSSNIDLQKLARSLPVDEETAFTDQDEPVRAIPDPWAQARSFGEALLSVDHSLHKQSRRRWRGLWAIMALHDRRQGDYVLSPIEVPLANGTMFEQVMTTLTPEVALSGCADLWRAPTLIMMSDPKRDPQGRNRVPIAMTNPICLISPGRDTWRRVIPNIYWAQGDLGDPLDPASGGTLTLAELSLLSIWLERLREELNVYDGPVADGIQNQLLEFNRDCEARAGAGQLEGEIRASIENKVPLPFRHLWNAPQLPEATSPAESSQLRVRMQGWTGSDVERERYGQNFKGVIFADQCLTFVPGLNPNQILVWGNHALSELLASPSIFDRVRTEASAAGYWLISSADLFTQRAVQLGNKAQIAGHPNGLQNMILPLRPLALMLAGNLGDRVSGTANQSRVAVTLKLRLDDGSGDGKAIDVTRHYSTEPQSDEGQMVTANDWAIYNAQVWPDFRSDAWTSYLARFLYPSALKGKMARPCEAVSRSLMQHVVANAKDGANAIAALGLINNGDAPKVGSDKLFKRAERLTGEGNKFTEEVQFASTPFDALLYKEGQGDSRAEAVAGLVLLGLTDVPKPSNPTKVAVDFGTTNTVACFGDNQAQPITFQQRVVLPILISDQTLLSNVRLAHRLSLSSMMPTDDRETPIPSVATSLQPYNPKETLWAFRNLIYFHVSSPPAEGGEADDLDSFRDSTKNAEFDLKWDPAERRREAATDFLTQFMVMTSAELLNTGVDAARSEWLFSVPEAMSVTARNAFRTSLDEAVRHIATATDTPQIGELQSEGLSAACYMLSDEKFVTDDLNIILDIGGGTTDVTIWDREDPIWKGSFYLAGQNFFTRLLCNNRDILANIGLETWAKTLDPNTDAGRNTSEKRRGNLAEMLFSGKARQGGGDNLQAAIDDHWGNRLSAKLGEPLRHAGQAYLGGIAWYLGKVVRQLIDNGTINEDRASVAAFAVCGRGGGLFKKMHGSAGSGGATDVTRTLSIFNSSVGLPDARRPSFAASNAAKLEVVRGMLTDHQMIDTDAGGLEGKRTELPHGLGLTFGDRSEAHPADIVPAKPVPQKVDKVDMAEFDAFLAALDAHSGVLVDLKRDGTDGAHRRIAAAVRSAMDAARKAAESGSKASSRQSQEPPFIIALRAMVDLLALSAEDREGVITTEADE